MVLEKESDGKVRAFMYVERFHLARLWAYRAIKEEINILHKILVRLNDQISKSDFAKNLAGFVEYQQKSSHQDDESKGLLEKPDEPAQIEQSEEGEDENSRLCRDIDNFVELNSHIIDGIALQNLRPDKVVIPLKRIVQELKISLLADVKEGKVKLEDFDQDSVTDYVNNFVSSLDQFVITKNRIGLYHKEGLGLSIALDAENLDEENY